MDSINEQNQRLATKLVSTTSDLRQNKLGDSYRKHLERKQMIKKYDIDEETGIVIPKKMKSLQKFRTLDPIGEGYSRYTGNSRISRLEN